MRAPKTATPNWYAGPTFADEESPTGYAKHLFDISIPAERAAWEAAWGERSTVPAPAERTPRAADMSPEAIAARELANVRLGQALAYVASYRGTWALILDIRSDRRFGTTYMRLSERQVEVILAAKVRDEQRAEAAQIARELSDADQYAQHVSAPVAAPVVAPEPVHEGLYTVAGEPWKVQHTREDHSRLYAKRLVVTDGEPRWDYVPGGLAVIRREGQAMTLDQAKAFGKLYGVCAVCGRELTDETSIAAGIGPICASKIGA